MRLQEQALTNLGYVKKDKDWWEDTDGNTAHTSFHNRLLVNDDVGSVILGSDGNATVHVGSLILNRKLHSAEARTLDIAEEYNRLVEEARA